MNAGAFGHAIGEVLTFVECVSENGDICQIGRESIGFSYRSTSLPGEPEARLIITRATFLFRQEDSSLVEARCREIVAQRRDKQPAGVGSAGSFFKNPQGDFAGRLIEQAGLKGLMRGRAMVSPKHANFIVNTGGAAPEDIIGLMQEVRARVLQHTGVLLEPEVHIL
jgi:UDP-N-acetylmuramate dehydrogenase